MKHCLSLFCIQKGKTMTLNITLFDWTFLIIPNLTSQIKQIQYLIGKKQFNSSSVTAKLEDSDII